MVMTVSRAPHRLARAMASRWAPVENSEPSVAKSRLFILVPMI